ncbi:MAG: hydroxyacylglutathione hydrolase [Kofleriaceae bacterium]
MRVVTVPCLSDNFAYLIIDGGRAVVVDPSEAAPIETALPKEDVALAAIWLTHHHWDHVGGVAELVDKHPGIDVVIGKLDADKLKPETRRCITRIVDDGDRVALNNVVAHVIHNPGHTLGAVSYHLPDHPSDSGSVFTGDTLFAAGCGRVFEGDPAMMYASLQKLARLPDRTKVYFGHEYTMANLEFAAAAEPGNGAVEVAMAALATPSTPSTIGEERATNPFLRADDAAEFARRREWKNTFK